jgi:predicted TIM-barrel fold metal-dependent hydrolase
MNKTDIHLHVRLENEREEERPKISCAQNMIVHMNSLGIQKGILMSGGEGESGFGNNEEMRTICERYPHTFAWMCNLDFQDIDTIYDRLAAYKAQGAIGIGELMINKRIDHPFLEALFTAAEKLELPVTIHMSSEEGYKYGIVDKPGLPLLEDVLKRHPNLKILGHSQVFWIEISGNAPTDREGRYKTGKGPVAPGGRLIELFETYPNLYGDLSANSAGKAIMRDEAFGLQFLEKFADRLLFATDMLTDDMIYPLGGWLDEQVAIGNLSKETYEKICSGNAKRVFGI